MSTTLRRTLRTALAATTLGSGLALGLGSAVAEPAHARQMAEGTPSGKLCYWDGKAYSQGGRVKFEGFIYVCQADGTWKRESVVVSPASSAYYR